MSTGCSLCSLTRPLCEFSKNQLKKEPCSRKCKECIGKLTTAQYEPAKLVNCSTAHFLQQAGVNMKKKGSPRSLALKAGESSDTAPPLKEAAEAASEKKVKVNPKPVVAATEENTNVNPKPAVAAATEEASSCNPKPPVAAAVPEENSSVSCKSAKPTLDRVPAPKQKTNIDPPDATKKPGFIGPALPPKVYPKEPALPPRNEDGVFTDSQQQKAPNDKEVPLVGPQLLAQATIGPSVTVKPKSAENPPSTPKKTFDKEKYMRCKSRLLQIYPRHATRYKTHDDCKTWVAKQLKKGGPHFDAEFMEKRIEKRWGMRATPKERQELITIIERRFPCKEIGKLLESYKGREEECAEDLVVEHNVDWKLITKKVGEGHSKPVAKSKAGKRCDKCDHDDHETSQCPFYKKEREKHPDAQRKKLVDIGSDGGNVFLDSRHVRVISQPGDGSCLFHSISRGLSNQVNGHSLRHHLTKWLRRNENAKISGTPVRLWVKWDANSSVESYCHRMERSSSWGGGLELAAASRLFKVNIHVYERERNGFKRISCFNVAEAGKTISVLYGGGIHFDAMNISKNSYHSQGGDFKRTHQQQYPESSVMKSKSKHQAGWHRFSSSSSGLFQNRRQHTQYSSSSGQRSFNGRRGPGNMRKRSYQQYSGGHRSNQGKKFRHYR